MKAGRQRMICLGGAVLDRKYHARGDLVFATSNPVDGSRNYGGVARNVTENLARLGVEVGFISIVGNDDAGHSLIRHLRDLGVDTSQMLATSEKPTAEYAAIRGTDNELVLGIADMDIFDLFTASQLDHLWPHLAAADWVFMDCNLPEETIAALLERKKDGSFRLAVDTVSTVKAARLPRDLSAIDLLFTNCDEANALLGRNKTSTRLGACEAAQALLHQGARQVILTLGAEGYVIATMEGLQMQEIIPATPVDITGAGDAMIAGTLYRLLASQSLIRAARTGACLASLTIEHSASVRPDLTPLLLEHACLKMASVDLILPT